MTSEAPAALHLLLVEDDDGDAVLVEELLHDAGIDTDVTRAWSLEAALDALAMPVDCILLDLGLPDASGLDALLQLRSASSAAVVVLTGLDDEDRGLEAVGAGADDYLVKGTVDGGGLGRAVRYAVERRRGDHEQRSQEEARARAEAVTELLSALRPEPWLPGAPVRALVRGDEPGPLTAQLCDVVERPDGTVLTLTGTAAGEGTATAAALSVTVRAAFRGLAQSSLPVTEVLDSLDRVVAGHGGSVGAVVVELTPRMRTAVCHLAGHRAPLLLSADAGPLTAAEVGGAPLGSGPCTRPAVQSALREQDRLLVLHTAVLEQVGVVPEGSSLGTVLEAASRGTGDDLALADTVERAVRAYGPELEVQFILLGWAP